MEKPYQIKPYQVLQEYQSLHEGIKPLKHASKYAPIVVELGETVTLSSLGIDTSSRLAFLCSLPSDTVMHTDRDGHVTCTFSIEK
ncbi:MAG: hypothetical protein PHC66_05155 [Candidatus Nanoarchaeia archaeon]|nr:hypothetical protein [Candidatus Nanoarchaeia archaeon]MDD5239074.1 hypothetical protein [Candidatus Nanoarchaeia archaeon]